MNGRVGILATSASVLIVALTGSAQSKKSADVVDAPPIHAFSVTLVVGEMQGASTPDNLPLGARKALTDMRDFLPYKSYRLLDTQFIRCCASVQPEQVRGRLRGLDEQPYSFLINVNSLARRLSIHFSLQESWAKSPLTSKIESAGSDEQIRETRKQLELRDAFERARQEIESSRRQLVGQETGIRDLSAELTELRAKPNATADQIEEKQRVVDRGRKELSQTQKTLAIQESAARELELKLSQAQHQIAQAQRNRELAEEQGRTAAAGPSAKNSVIDSTFSMDVGETVVIGTSSLKGDKALIALLTAVRRPDAPQGEKK